MKRVIITILLLIIFSFPVFAKGTNFTTTDIPNEEKQKILDNINIKKIETYDNLLGFDSFDVNDNGNILLVYHTSVTTLLVFDGNFDFMYGFEIDINENGGAEWNGENIILYTYRSYLLHEIDSNGNIIELKKVDDVLSNSYLFATEKTVNGATYKAEKSFPLSSTYSIITKTDINNNKTILFDVSKENLTGNIIIFSLVSIVVIGAVIGVIVYTTEQNKKGQSNNTGVGSLRD